MINNKESKYEYSVVGASGFIGSNMVSYLEGLGFSVLKIGRDLEDIKVKELGTVIYCAGFGDCKNAPDDVVDANLVFLNKLIRKFSYKKLFYISSTRVYLNNDLGEEGTALQLSVDDQRRLFNLSKLVAESFLEHCENAFSLRVSNAYGNAFESPLFLPSIVRDAISNKLMNIYTTPSYAKDYVNVTDVCFAVYRLSQKNKLKYKVYNVASGENVTSTKIVTAITNKIPSEVIWHNVSSEDKFPLISIARLQSEIDYRPLSIISDLDEMIKLFSMKFNE